MRTYNAYNAKSGAINRPEKVIYKLGAEEGRGGVNQPEASEGWGYWEQDLQRPWGRREPGWLERPERRTLALKWGRLQCLLRSACQRSPSSLLLL